LGALGTRGKEKVSKEFPIFFCAKKPLITSLFFFFCNVESSRPSSSPCYYAYLKGKKGEKKNKGEDKKAFMGLL